jgi:hypothetical protein
MGDPEVQRVAPGGPSGWMPVIAGLVLGLLGIGLPMIGVTINLWLGFLLLAIAFALIAWGCWIWEGKSPRRAPLRIATICIFAVAYFSLVGIQIRAQYKKDHPTVSRTAPGTPKTEVDRDTGGKVIMTEWGGMPGGKVFANVTVESPPAPSLHLHMILIARVQDSAIDEMEDTRIEKSSLRDVIGQTIEITVSRQFQARVYRLKFAKAILVLLPGTVQPAQISKLSDVLRVGGTIMINNGFVWPVFPQTVPKAVSALPQQLGNGAHVGAQGRASGTVGGSVTQGPGSIAQIGGTGNTAIIGKPEWTITKNQQIEMRDILKGSVGRVRLDDQVFQPSSHLHATYLGWPFREAGWTIVDQPKNYAGDVCNPSPDWDCEGVGIWVRDKNSDLAKEVGRAFSSQNIPITFIEDASAAPDLVVILAPK